MLFYKTDTDNKEVKFVSISKTMCLSLNITQFSIGSLKVELLASSGKRLLELTDQFLRLTWDGGHVSCSCPFKPPSPDSCRDGISAWLMYMLIFTKKTTYF